MSKIKNSGSDQYGTEPSNSSNLEQLALRGLTFLFYFSSVFHFYDNWNIRYFRIISGKK